MKSKRHMRQRRPYRGRPVTWGAIDRRLARFYRDHQPYVPVETPLRQAIYVNARGGGKLNALRWRAMTGLPQIAGQKTTLGS